MPFLFDECKPREYDDVWFHRPIYDRLKQMSNDKSIPHIIIHGCKGSGKKTMMQIFLKMLYGKDVNKTQKILYNVCSSGNKIKQEEIQQSLHHIVIEPTNTNYDKYLVQEIVKTYAQTNVLKSKNTNKCKTIQISNLDKLTHSAQTSLRRMIEVNSHICRFVMWCDNLSNVIDPLKSRCICIRLAAPKPEDLYAYLVYISALKNIDIKLDDVIRIVKYSECNIEKALLYLEYNMHGYNDYMKTNYTDIMNRILLLILNKEIDKIEDVRDMFYNICITNYDGVYIMRDILKKVIRNKKLSEQCKANIIIKTSDIEYNMLCGRREIIHFDAFIINIMRCIHIY